MAPMDQLRQESMEELRRRHIYTDESSLRRRDGGDGGSNKGGKRGDGDGSNNDGGDGNDDNSNDDGNGKNRGNPKNDEKDDNDGKNEKRPSAAASQLVSSPPPAFAPSSSPSLPPSPVSIPTTSSISPSVSPTTILLVSTTTAPPILSISSSNTFVSTFFPITSSTPPTFSFLPESTPQPRHGVSDPPFFPSSIPQTTVTATATSWINIVPESAVASSATSTHTSSSSKDNNDNNNHHKSKHNDNDKLSPTAQHLLIAVGAIGAFILVIAGIYFLTRMRKIDIFASLRNRKFRRGGPRGWYGWRKEEIYYMNDPPPKYSGDSYLSDIPTQQKVEAFYTPSTVPHMATPATAATALARSDSGHQEVARDALLDNAAPFASSPAAQPVATSATANFYGFAAQPTSLSREPGSQNSQNSFVSRLDPNTATQNTFTTMNTMRTVQTQDVYDPNQREPNHLSYLSSLSSGFGDGLIIPEPTVVGGGRQSYRQSKAPGAGRFSWMTGGTGSKAPGYGDRDTVYTTASIETAPRFRTVNSWVAQQAGRVERQPGVPAIPGIPLPLPLMVGSAPTIDHQRKISEDPAFRQHPGDEIRIGQGSRVPSAILDKKVGMQ